MQEYYQHPFTSNSDLTRLKQELSGQDMYETADAFAMGSLVDAMLTQPERVDYYKRTVKEVDYDYTSEQMEQGIRMAASAKKDTIVQRLMPISDYQVPFYTKGMRFQHNNMDIWMDMKCLYDWLARPAAMGGDYKSTVCTNEKSFRNAIDRFDYDRARVLYMLQSGLSKDVIIGISKKAPYPVFKVFIQQGDETWQRGLSKLNEIVYKKYMLT